jgi:TonB family protein
MVPILIGVTVIFAIAWCATSLLHRVSAASRHVIWTCAFAAVLLLAPMRWGLPHRALTASSPAITTSSQVAAPRHAPAPPLDPASVLMGLWGAGTTILMLRLLLNALRMAAMARSARGRRPILVSPGIRGPVVLGVLRPVILLPADSATWTRSRRRAVLAHEAAHIRRRDPAILMAAHIATALYWFHPLCWLAAARLRAESERACDDAALRIGLRPSGYAGHLLDLARKFDIQLAIPMATTSHLESRVKFILDPATNRSFPARTVWCAAILVTAALLAPLATLTLHAQQAAGGTASIAGTVFDPTGARVPGAVLTAANTDVTYEVSAVANAVGAYSFHNLPAGHYTVEASVPGFAKFRGAGLALVSGGKIQVDANLEVDKIALSSVVTAQSAARTQTPAAAADGKPIRVGGNVRTARLLRKVSPDYPADLQAQGVEGTVVLQAVISKEGVPLSLKVQNTGTNPEFVDAAMAAFRQWRFQPTLLNGEPIEVLASSQFDFRLSAQTAVIDDRLREPAIDDRLRK